MGTECGSICQKESTFSGKPCSIWSWNHYFPSLPHGRARTAWLGLRWFLSEAQVLLNLYFCEQSCARFCNLLNSHQYVSMLVCTMFPFYNPQGSLCARETRNRLIKMLVLFKLHKILGERQNCKVLIIISICGCGIWISKFLQICTLGKLLFYLNLWSYL